MPEAKQNKRLLTPEETQDAVSKSLIRSTFIKIQLGRVAKAQDAKTLKEVGEWLEYALENEFITITQTNEYTISPSVIREIIKALKRGEMLCLT